MPEQDIPDTNAATPSPVRIGWIGAGVMGAAMCRNLADAGLPVVLFSRTKAKCRALLRHENVRWGESPKVVVKASDVVFTMLGYPQEVKDVYLGEEGLLAGAREGRLLIDMTTTRPSLAREIHAASKPRGVGFVDAPVSGGDVGARNATLSIMVGGMKKDVKRALEILPLLGTRIVHQGRPGNGQHAKMCNQIAIAGTMVGVCESLLYAAKSGLDVETMLESINGGAAACWSLKNLAPRIVERDFEPGFYVEHFIKDMGIALDEAKRLGIALPGLALVHQLYLSLQAQGHGKAGTQALILALEHLSNIDGE